MLKLRSQEPQFHDLADTLTAEACKSRDIGVVPGLTAANEIVEVEREGECPCRRRNESRRRNPSATGSVLHSPQPSLKRDLEIQSRFRHLRVP